MSTYITCNDNIWKLTVPTDEVSKGVSLKSFGFIVGKLCHSKGMFALKTSHCCVCFLAKNKEVSLFCISDLSPSFVVSPFGFHFKGFPLPTSVSTGD